VCFKIASKRINVLFRVSVVFREAVPLNWAWCSKRTPSIRWQFNGTWWPYQCGTQIASSVLLLSLSSASERGGYVKRPICNFAFPAGAETEGEGSRCARMWGQISKSHNSKTVYVVALLTGYLNRIIIFRGIEWNSRFRSDARPYKGVGVSGSGFGPRVTRLGWERRKTVPGAIWEKLKCVGTRREQWLSKCRSTFALNDTYDNWPN